jgi:hypothetical protein
VIIFDWDDTLLASSFIFEQKENVDCNQLKLLESYVFDLITLALQHAEVHIITNAADGWIQISCQKYIPGVIPLLDKVTITSARSTYEKCFPNDPMTWKLFAFRQCLTRIFSSTTTTHKNIISFGDSLAEREAIHNACYDRPNTLCKSFKLINNPSIEQLREQLKLIIESFTNILQHEEDMDLMLSLDSIQVVPGTVPCILSTIQS